MNEFPSWLRIILVLLTITFIITLVTCFFFPIYPDEIAARIWLSRLPYDFPNKISNMPTCVSRFSQSWPVTWYLPGAINWLISGNAMSPIMLRLVGFGVAFAWVGVLSLYLKVKFDVLRKNRCDQFRLNIFIVCFFVSILSIGVFPIFLIVNRNEQLIPISITILMFVFIGSSEAYFNGSLWRKFWLVILYFTTISLVIYGHPKGLFLTPFFAIVGWRLFRNINNHLLIGISTVILVFQILQGYIAWNYLLECNEVPMLNASLKSFSFEPFSIFYDPPYFFHNSIDSLMHFYRYLDQIGFQKTTDISYLPPSPVGFIGKIANFFIRLDVTITFFLCLFLLPAIYYRRDLKNHRLVTINLSLIILLVCTIISGIFNLPKNWYDLGYLYALLLIVLTFFIGEDFNNFHNTRFGMAILSYMVCVSILSQSVFVYRLLPAFLQGYEGPGISIVRYLRYGEKNRNDAIVVARENGINSVSSEGVILDDLTYFYFQKTKRPMAITYIFYDNDPLSIRHFLVDVKSSGMVVRCSSMPNAYLFLAKKEGSMCSLSSQDLKKVPITP